MCVRECVWASVHEIWETSLWLSVTEVVVVVTEVVVVVVVVVDQLPVYHV